MKDSLIIFFLLGSHLLFAQVTIQGTVRSPKDHDIHFVETGGFTNITASWRDKRYKAHIDENHHFSITLPERDIDRWRIKTSNGYQFFDLIKGKNIEAVVDFSKPNPITAVGCNAADFNYLTYASINDTMGAAYEQWISDKDIDRVLVLRKKMAYDKIAFLRRYKEAHQMSEAYYRWMESRLSYEPYERTDVENIANNDSLRDAMLPKLLEKGMNDDYAALNTVEYNDLVATYMRSQFKSANTAPTPQAYFDAATSRLKGKTCDVFLTRFTASAARTNDSVYNPIFSLYNQVVKDQSLKRYVIEERQNYLATLTAKQEPIARYSSLNKIFSKYLGHVLYVDFWASWCIPCRSEMPHSMELEKRFKDNAVVFIYLGYKDTKNAWLKARKDLGIEGEHFLLDDRLIEEAKEAFNISGIPHYVIIDKAGDIISKNADRPMDVYQQLSDLVEKQ